MACGDFHSVLIRSDGEAVAFGSNADGQIEVPKLPRGLIYVAAEAGCRHTILLRSDGHAIAFGANEHNQCAVPALPPGVKYIKAAAGNWHTVLLRSDGEAVAFGRNSEGQCNIPDFELTETRTATIQGRGRLTPIRKMESKAKSEGTAAGTGMNFTSLQERSRSRYVAVAAGAFHTVLIRSDGSAVGSRGSLQIPRLPAGIRYIAVAANLEHTLFLRSDGHAVSCTNDSVECSLTSLTPSLPVGMMYTSIASGGHHAVLLRSDGQAIAFGHNGDGRCNIPPCPLGTWYTAVAAGLRHSLLLRSDGKAVAFGENHLPPGHRSFGGPCDVPILHAGYAYCTSVESDRAVKTVSPKTTDKTVNRPPSWMENIKQDEAQKRHFDYLNCGKRISSQSSPLFAAW